MRLTHLLAGLFGVAFLTALLYPWFANVKQGSPRNLCLSHLKQTGTGLLLYAADVDDRFPPRDAWMDVTYPYVKNREVYHCPQAPRGAWGYAFDAALDQSKARGEPSEIPMLYDSVNPTRNASDLVASLPAHPRHHGSNMIAYADGHVKGLRLR